MFEPYFKQDNITIYNGNSLAVLNQLPDESVNCCVTSPPYWGLRDYGLEPIIWDEIPCEHEWGNKIIRKDRGAANNSDFIGQPREMIGTKTIQGQFCQLCGAWLGNLGLEPTPELYVKHITDIFREVRRVLRKDGTLWLNLGDSYAGSGCGTNDYRTEASRSINKSDVMFTKKPPQQKVKNFNLKPKDLVGIPWMVAFALRADGWYLRQDIIWNKHNPAPESVKDRCTKSHEYIFLLSKSPKYYFDADAIREPNQTYDKRNISEKAISYKSKFDVNNRESVGSPRAHAQRENYSIESFYNPNGRNKRSVWTVNTKPFPGAHFAVFPPDLIIPCILAGCPEGGLVLDPFCGAGTTGLVCANLNRQFIGIDLKKEYCDISIKRIKPIIKQQVLF